MPHLDRNYWPFYLEGRDATRLPKRDIDCEALAAQILSGDGKSFRETIHAAAEAAITAHWTPRKRKTWLDDNEEDIRDAGGDVDQAYRAWTQGVTDELSSVMERELIRAMDTELG